MRSSTSSAVSSLKATSAPCGSTIFRYVARSHSFGRKLSTACKSSDRGDRFKKFPLVPPRQQLLFFFPHQPGKWNQWKCGPGSPRGHSWPQGRRAHSSVVFDQSLLVYGGYQDMRGSLSELWQFSLGNRLLVNLSRKRCQRRLSDVQLPIEWQ